MKNLRYILPSLLLLFTPLFAQAALQITYAGAQGVGLGTYTAPPLFSAVPVGSAYTNRRVLINIIGGPSYWAPTGIKINGVDVGSNWVDYRGSGSPVGSFSGQIIWAWSDAPTSTTVTVEVTTPASNLNGSGGWTATAYTFDNTLAASAPTTTKSNVASPATSLSNAIATDANGFLIASVVTALHVSTSGLGVTASDETLTDDNSGSEGSGKYLVSSKKSGTASSAASNVTWGWTNSSQALSSLLFWGPAAAATPASPRHMRLFEGYKIKLVSGKLKLYQY